MCQGEGEAPLVHCWPGGGSGARPGPPRTSTPRSSHWGPPPPRTRPPPVGTRQRPPCWCWTGWSGAGSTC